MIFTYFCPFLLQRDPDLLESLMGILYDPTPEVLDCKMFSPLHSQVQVELGSNYLCNPVTNDINNNNRGLPVDNETNNFDVNKFLNSVLVSSDEYSYEDGSMNSISVFECGTPSDIKPMNGASVRGSGSCSDSEAEEVQGQVKRNSQVVTNLIYLVFLGTPFHHAV